MRTIRFQTVTLLALLAPLAFLSLPGPLSAASDDAISEAIDKGIDALLRKIREKQFTGKQDNKGEGRVALETYALLVAGVSVDDPMIEKNFKRLSRMQLNHTYSTSCYAFALDAAINQIHSDMQFAAGRAIPDSPRIGKEFRGRLEKCIQALLKMKHRDAGRWNYGPDPAGKQWDNSNVQFAVLALGLARKRNIEIEPKIWEQVALHFVDGQQKDGPLVKDRIELLPEEEAGEGRRDRVKLVNRERDEEKDSKSQDEKDGKRGRSTTTSTIPKAVPEIGDEHLEVKSRGWSYRNDKGHGGYKWNMSCAGLSSLILADQNLRGKVPADFQAKINRSLRDGYGWMMKNWNINGGGGGWKYYGYYSLEKVGDLGGVKKFGKHDWYQELADAIIKEQKDDGSWPGNNEEKIRENSAFALLILNRATSLLTQRADRMVITGPGAHRSDRSDRDSWVYIQSLDRELHIPSVLKTVRLRPSAKLLKFVELIVENYPPERIGHLVPKLTRLFDRVEHPRTKKYFLDLLTTATGLKARSMDAYKDWTAQWIELTRIGEEVQKDQAGRLVELYRNVGDNVILRQKAIWASGRIRAREAASLLVSDLDHKDERVRMLAYSSLAILPLGSATVPEYDAKAKSSTRRKQIKEVEAWLKSVNG